MAKLQIEIEINDKGTPTIRQLGQVTAEVGKKAEEAGRGFGQLEKKVGDTTGRVTDLLNPMTLLNVAVGAGLVAALKSSVGQATQFADEIHRLQLLTGSSVRHLASLVDVANDVGVEFNAVQMALLRLANQSGETDGVLAQFNLTAKDGVGRLVQFAQKMSGVTDANQRAAIASDVFGARIAAGLLPLMERLRGGIDSLSADTNDFANILGDDGVTALRNFGIAQGQVGDALLALKLVVAKDLLPVIGPLVSGIESMVKWFYAVPAPVRAAVEVLGLAAGAITAVNLALRLFGVTTLAMTGPTGWIASAVVGIAVLVTSLDGLGSKLSSLWTDFKNRGMTPVPAPNMPGASASPAMPAPVILPKDVLEADNAIKKQIETLKGQRIELEQGAIAALEYNLAHGEMAKASPALKAQLVALTQQFQSLNTKREMAHTLQEMLNKDTNEATEAVRENVKAMKEQNKEIALSTLADARDELKEYTDAELAFKDAMTKADKERSYRNLLMTDESILIDRMMEEFDGTISRTKELLQWEQERIDLLERLKKLSPHEAAKQHSAALDDAVASLKRFQSELRAAYGDDAAELIKLIDREILKFTADQKDLQKSMLTFGSAVEKAFGGILDILSLFGVKVGKFILLLQNMPRAIGGLREVFAGLGGLLTLSAGTFGLEGTAFAETAQSVSTLGNASGETAGVLGFFAGTLTLAAKAVIFFSDLLSKALIAAGVPAGPAGVIGSLVTSGGIGYGLGSLLFGHGPGGAGAGIGSLLGTGAGMLFPGLGMSILSGGTLGPAFGGLAGMLGGQLAGMLANVVLPGIGFVIGGVLGKLLGGLFSGPKPQISGQVRVNPTTIDELLAAQQVTAGQVINPPGRSQYSFLQSGPFLLELFKHRTQGVLNRNETQAAILNIIISTIQAAIKGLTALAPKLPDNVSRQLSERIDAVLTAGFEVTDFNIKGKNTVEKFRKWLEQLSGATLEAFTGQLFPGIDLAAIGADNAVKGFDNLLASMSLLSDVLRLSHTNVETMQIGLQDFAHASVALVEQFRRGEETFEQTIQRLAESFGQLFQLIDQLATDNAAAIGNTTTAIAVLVNAYQHATEQTQAMADALTVAIESGANPEEVLAAANAIRNASAASISILQQIAAGLQRINEAIVSGVDLYADLEARIRALNGIVTSLDALIAGAVRLGLATNNLTAQISIFGSLAHTVALSYSDFLTALPRLAGIFRFLLQQIHITASNAEAIAQLQTLAQAVTSSLQIAAQTVTADAARARDISQRASDERIEALELERQAIEEAIRAQEEAARAQEEALRTQLEGLRAWQQIADSAKAQLVDLFNLLAPTHPVASFNEVLSQFRAAVSAFSAEATTTNATAVQTLARQTLHLAQGVPGMDLPSQAFHTIAAEVQTALEAIKMVAEGQPTEQELLAQIAVSGTDHTIRLAQIDAQIAAERESLRTTLDSISATEQAQLTRLHEIEASALNAIRDELAARLAALRAEQEAARLALQQIIGAVSFEEFIAQKQAEAANTLLQIRDVLRTYLGNILSGLHFQVPAMASGGIVTRPTLALIGESGPEAVVPLSRNSLVNETKIIVSPQITIHADSHTNGRRVGREVVQEIKEAILYGELRQPVQQVADRR